MKIYLEQYLGKIIFFILSISLFIGLYLNEDSSGGGATSDFNTTWQYVLNLKEDLFFHYTHWKNIHLPLHYIIISTINSFLAEQYHVRFFYCIISLLVPFLFYLNLKIKFPEINKNLLLVFASTLFILPTFRYTAIWTNVQITANIFFLLSIYFYLKWDERKINTFDKNLILQILFVTLATYTRQDYVIFYLYFMITYLKKIKFKTFLLLSALVLFLSLPGLIFVHEQNAVLSGIKFTPKFQNSLLVNSSIMSFYLIPIFLCFFLNDLLKLKQNIKFMAIAFILFSILIFIFSNSFNYNYKLGGGFILKLSMILFDNFILFFISSALGFVALAYLAKNNINNFIIIFLLLFGYSASWIFQKYFEPMFIFIFFLLMQSEISFNFLKRYKNILLIYAYFAIYLASAIVNDLFQITKQI